ncbi:MAG TPA: hypothetical protein VF311_14905 [Terriglobales bacterium]
MVGAAWWDSHFLTLDYGFGKSSASAHLHVRTQNGKLKTVGEFVAAHLPACEFAAEVVRRFVVPTREVIAPLAAQGDLTSCLIRWQQMTEDSQPHRRPARLGRHRR